MGMTPNSSAGDPNVRLVSEDQGTEPSAEVAANFGKIDFAHLPLRQMQNLGGERTRGFQIIATQSAMNKVHEHGDSSPRSEVCGVLVGNVYCDQTGPFVLIEHIVVGRATSGDAGHVTFTADTWQHIHSEMDRLYSDHRIVGWYHTHPGHGLFLSEMDLFLHTSFFGLPWQVALVYDPQLLEDGMFSTNAGMAERNAFLIEADEQPIARPSKPKLPPAPKPRKKSYFWTRLRNCMLGFIGLVMFSGAGFSAGKLIQMQHLQLPQWIRNMAQF
jgi:proteasome lid subunit RPN8/RPN11